MAIASTSAVVFIAILCPWNPGFTSPEKSPELDHVTLQLKWKHQFQFAGYYAAQKKGFYKAAGLDVQLLEATEAIEPALP